MEENFWRKCSACKKQIQFKAKYYICSVSTCNGQRTGYVFCSVLCWDSHVAEARHRNSGALERKSPNSGSAAPEPRRIIVPSQELSKSEIIKSGQVSREILIVASKLKDYIRVRSEMNTSAGVLDVLSDYVRFRCDEAIESARREGR